MRGKGGKRFGKGPRGLTRSIRRSGWQGRRDCLRAGGSGRHASVFRSEQTQDLREEVLWSWIVRAHRSSRKSIGMAQRSQGSRRMGHPGGVDSNQLSVISFQFSDGRKPRNEEKRVVACDRKSPPFPQEAGEGWGTLKFKGKAALDETPYSKIRGGIRGICRGGRRRVRREGDRRGRRRRGSGSQCRVHRRLCHERRRGRRFRIWFRESRRDSGDRC